MSAYSDWKCGAISDEQYRSAMRRECEEPRETLPFYTDDADDPHWRCENCAHCKEYKMFTRIIDNHPRYFYESEDSLHKKEDKACYTIWVKPDRTDYESIWLCEIDRAEHMDDDYCAEFEEIEDHV